MSAQLDAHVIRVDGSSRVLVRGEVDLSTRAKFQDALLTAQDSDHVVVDLAGVTFMDSSGINTLVRAYKRVPSGGSLRVVGAAPFLQRLFQITGLLDLLSSEPARQHHS